MMEEYLIFLVILNSHIVKHVRVRQLAIDALKIIISLEKKKKNVKLYQIKQNILLRMKVFLIYYVLIILLNAQVVFQETIVLYAIKIII